MSSLRKPSQAGGTFLGIVIGLLIGLGAALAVAIYVTKVPVPFANKGNVTKQTPEQQAAEEQKNKNWDPNAPLHGKNPAKPATSGTVGTATGVIVAPPSASTGAGATATAAATKPAASAPKAAASAPKSSDPLGDLAKAKTGGTSTASTTPGVDPFVYFVQAGAFKSQADAEAQKAKLSIAGFEAKITEREQAGSTVYRVRIGPMDKREMADKTKETLDGNGFESAIVRVQR
jgi:cell division protein FtsN